MPLRIGRRVFLRTAAGAILGLPFMPSLLPRAQALPGRPPRRFVGILGYSGQFVADWFPAWTPPGYQLRDTAFPTAPENQGTWGDKADGTTYPHENVPGTSHTWARLSDFAEQGISTVIGTSMNPYLDRMLLLRGLDILQSTGHGHGSFMGNFAASTYWESFGSRGLGQMPTVDQVLAHSDAFYEAAPRQRSLQLGTGWPSSFSFTNYGAGGAVEQMANITNAHSLWQTLFGDFMPADTPAEDPNRLLMNALHEDYARTRGNRRLGAADRETLERHMAFLADIERQLGEAGPACVPPGEPPQIYLGQSLTEVSSVEDFRLNVSLMIDMAVAAIRCDLTRVVTMNIDRAVTDASGEAAVSLHNSDDVAGDWHDFAHDAAYEELDHAHIVSLNRWIVEEVFGRFLQGLDVEEAEGRTFLDNSLVCQGGELAMDHYTVGQPILMAGSAGGTLQTGYYVDYTQLDHGYANPILPWGVLIPGIPYNRLLVTILQAMGLSPSDYERDGRAGYGHNEIFDIAYAWPDDAYDMSQIGAPLPGIFLGEGQ